MSEALLFAETISVHNMFSPGVSLEFSCIELVIQSLNLTNNLSSYCGLVDAKIRASDKDLPVLDYNRIYFSFTRTTLRFVSGFYSFIRCQLVSVLDYDFFLYP